jgi:hypothetical protein
LPVWAPHSEVMTQHSLPPQDVAYDTLRQSDRRATALIGLLSAALGLATFALIGAVPDTDDGGPRLVRFVSDHRTALLAGSIALTLSAVSGVAFFVGLWRYLRPTQHRFPLAADMGLAGSLLVFAMVGVSGGALQAEAFVAGRHGGLAPGLAEGLNAIFVSVLNLSAAPTVLLAAGFGVALLSSNLSRWLGWSLIVVGVVHAGALLSVADHGPLTPAGVFTYAAPALYTLWILAASLALLGKQKALALP